MESTFKLKLERILPLILSYAADYYGLQSFNNLNSALEKIGEKTFVNKCHEGYKLAQSEIINALIAIERSDVSLKRSLVLARRSRDKEKEKATLADISKLRLQRAVFMELANVMAWTILGMDRTRVKALIQPNMHNKSLLQSNFQSVIEAANYYNKDPNKFALITDITSCIGMGDLILIDIQKKEFILIEVKEGRINDVILDTLSQGDLDITKNYLHGLSSENDAVHFFGQFKRVVHQFQKSYDALQYNRTGTGKDLFTGQNKQIVDLTALVDEKFTPLIFEGLKELYSQTAKNEIYLPFDCGLVGLVRNPTKSRSWDFQHFIFHTIIQPKSECAYLKHKPNNITEVLKNTEVLHHFREITSIPIYSLRNKVFIFTHEPIFFNVPIKQAVDIFTDKLSVYIYFDLNTFIDLCGKLSLEPALEDYEKSVQDETKYVRSTVVKFGNKCLTYGIKNVRSKFTYGVLYRIIYEFQTAKSVVEQMKGMIDYLKKIPS
jgi:hypothetical protein